MFWTDFVKGACKFVLAVGILASLWLGIAMMDMDGGLGFLVMLAGVLVSFLLVSFFMMICEISTNIAESNEKLSRLIAQQSGDTKNTGRSSLSNALSATKSQPLGGSSTSTPGPKHGHWYCPMCGKLNPDSSRVCMDCEYIK